LLGIGPNLLQDGPGNAVAVGQNRGQEMQRVHFRISPLPRQRLGVLQGFLGLERQFVHAKGHSGNPWYEISGRTECPIFSASSEKSKFDAYLSQAATYVKSSRRKWAFGRAH